MTSTVIAVNKTTGEETVITNAISRRDGYIIAEALNDVMKTAGYGYKVEVVFEVKEV